MFFSKVKINPKCKGVLWTNKIRKILLMSICTCLQMTGEERNLEIRLRGVFFFFNCQVNEGFLYIYNLWFLF
jgi:hypothetical protein